MDEDFFLVYKMQRGDEKAMDTFVRKYYTTMLKYCQYHTSNDRDSEDIAQETFLHFFKALPGYKHYGKAGNFLYRIAGNLCKDHYKKKIAYLLPEDLKPEEDRMKLINDRIDMEQALHKLPEEFYEVIVLYYFQELRLKEIAEILDIGLPLVKYRIRKAKEELGQVLGKEE